MSLFNLRSHYFLYLCSLILALRCRNISISVKSSLLDLFKTRHSFRSQCFLGINFCVHQKQLLHAVVRHSFYFFIKTGVELVDVLVNFLVAISLSLGSLNYLLLAKFFFSEFNFLLKSIQFVLHILRFLLLRLTYKLRRFSLLKQIIFEFL